MGQIEAQPRVIDINSKDLEENKVSLQDLNEKSKTSLLSMNIKKNYITKSRHQRKKKIDYEYVEPFIELEDLEVCLKYLEKDYSKHEDYFSSEFDRFNMIFHQRFENKSQDVSKLNEIHGTFELKRKEIEKFFLDNFEKVNKLSKADEVNDEDPKHIGHRNKNKALILKPSKRAELDQLAEYDKVEREFEKEKLDLKDPLFLNNMNLLILKYENVSLIGKLYRNLLSIARIFS